MNDTIIREVLWPCGLSGRYRGFPLLITAIRLCIENEGQARMVFKSLYARVAEERGCPLYCVERNIRTVIKRAWAVNPGYMRELAGYPMAAPPSSTEFIEIISSYILREHLTKRV